MGDDYGGLYGLDSAGGYIDCYISTTCHTRSDQGGNKGMRLLIDSLAKRYKSLRGPVFALNGVSLEIEDGEFFVLLGPSGSGKSTLLNLISGLEKPTMGDIWFDGSLVASGSKKVFWSPRDRNVAFVFQSYALYPHLNVFENIAFPLRIKGVKKAQVKRAVEETASKLEISGLLCAKPGELSGGQRQRVAIARAIVRRPSTFLLDEPLSNLDPQLRFTMRSELKDLQRNLGITTVYVTHDQIEAMSLGDRIAVLRDGGIEQIGAPGARSGPRVCFGTTHSYGTRPLDHSRHAWTKRCHGVLLDWDFLHLPARALFPATASSRS